MTDKQIIIDDVDISGCEYCLKMTKYRCTIQRDVYKCLCEENPNCHYKQLKRKEQECKNLEEEIRGCRIGIKNISIENTEIFKISEKYKQALDKIEKLIPKFDTSTECDYGDFDCENCSSLDEEIVCGYKLKKIIKGIINKVKEK